MTCRQCNTQNPDDARFCSNCGAELEQSAQPQKTRECPHCGFENTREARYCANCGAHLRRQRPQPHHKEHHQYQQKKKEKRVDTRLRWHPAEVVVLIIGGVILLLTLPYLTGNPPGRKQRPAPLIEQRSGDPKIEANVQAIASKFICSCGTCGEQPLDICTCDTAVREREFIRSSLQAGQSPNQVIAAVNTTFGWMKPEFAAQDDSLPRASANKSTRPNIASGKGIANNSYGSNRGNGPSMKIKPPAPSDPALSPILSTITNNQRIATAADRLEIFAQFKCPCGQCGIDELKDCSCNHPRGAKEVKAFIDEKISTGKFTVAQLITEVEMRYGGRKF